MVTCIFHLLLQLQTKFYVSFTSIQKVYKYIGNFDTWASLFASNYLLFSVVTLDELVRAANHSCSMVFVPSRPRLSSVYHFNFGLSGSFNLAMELFTWTHSICTCYMSICFFPCGSLLVLEHSYTYGLGLRVRHWIVWL
jgi:hypothetical protein